MPSALCFEAKFRSLEKSGFSLKGTSLKNGGSYSSFVWVGGGDVTDALEVVSDSGSRKSLVDGSTLSEDSDADPTVSFSGCGAGWKRLDRPDTTIPGCRPRNGESKDKVPSMRCLNG